MKKGLFKFTGMMGICCILPIVLMAALPFLSGILGATGTGIVAAIAPFICPLVMGGAMLMLFKAGKGHSCCSQEAKNESSIKDN